MQRWCRSPSPAAGPLARCLSLSVSRGFSTKPIHPSRPFIAHASLGKSIWLLFWLLGGRFWGACLCPASRWGRWTLEGEGGERRRNGWWGPRMQPCSLHPVHPVQPVVVDRPYFPTKVLCCGDEQPASWGRGGWMCVGWLPGGVGLGEGEKIEWVEEFASSSAAPACLPVWSVTLAGPSTIMYHAAAVA